MFRWTYLSDIFSFGANIKDAEKISAIGEAKHFFTNIAQKCFTLFPKEC